MANYLKIFNIINRTYGLQLRPVGTFLLLQLRHLIDGTTRTMDHMFYPGFREVKIDRPIFIIGNPRSGTTFLHRFLLETEQVAAFELWEMLLPSITAQKIFGGVIDKFAAVSPAKYHGSDAHQTSLRDVETDDVAPFINYLDGGFAWSYFFAWEDDWESQSSQRVFNESLEHEDQREQLYRFMEGCWRRNMHLKKKNRFVAKSSLFTLRTESLLERYPDAKFIYLVRDPLETIPSGLSLITSVLEKAYNMFESTPKDKLEKYLKNLYRASCHLYEKFYQTQKERPLPESNLRIVTYPNLIKNLENTMTDLVDFLEIHPAPGFEEKLNAQAQKQRSYKSKHKYSLDKFNLTEEQIRRDLAFVYDSYDLAM